jgi:hypothetical protein
MEVYFMPLIRKGHVVSTHWGVLVVLFSALLGTALFDPGLGTAQELKQISLTEKQVQGFLIVSPEIAKLSRGAYRDNEDVQAQAESLVRRHGFANLAEFHDVSINISMIMSGIDQQTKTFTEPPEQIKQQIAAFKSDKSLPKAGKKELLAHLEATLKGTKPIQFKENIALVLKYFDTLAKLMQEQASD